MGTYRKEAKDKGSYLLILRVDKKGAFILVN